MTMLYNTFVCPVILYQTYEHNILKMNEPILLQFTVAQLVSRAKTCNFGGQEVKAPTLGVRRSKFKVTGGQS